MGKASREKGRRGEQNLVNLFRSWGLRAERVGVAYAPGHDIDVYKPGRDAPFVVELKSRAEHPKWLTGWLGENDMLALKSDRADVVFIIPERVLRELLTQ